jgi:DNA processing protein
VVGARNCSANAMAFTKKITQELQGLNFAIASGLARGIDTVAHKASLPNTIAVIAGGLGHIYPPENKDLYHEIAKHGLIVAELPFGTAPLAQHFPQRNRIISGISLATIVMEASLQSGSLITAKFALDQGREVFAVPGFPMDPRSSGTNKLIKDGALVVENVADIVNNLPTLEYYKSKFEELKANFVTEKLINSDIVDAEARKAIISLLSGAPIDVEIIVQYTNLPINIVNIVLLELELANKILRSSSNKITLLYQ